jgi:hypothetical protein
MCEQGDAMTTLRRWTLLAILAAAGAGCADTGLATEEGSSTVSVGGKSVYLSFWARGWPGGEQTRGEVEVTHDDSAGWCLGGDGSEVDIDGDRIALPDMWPSSSSRGSGNFINRIELEANTTGLFGGWGSDLAIALFWRRAGSRDSWRPVNCGILPAASRMRDSDVDYYDPDLVEIDYNRLTITAAAPGSDEESRSFSACGVNDRSPEFSAFVFPNWNSCNMEDIYEYTLEASCDNRACPRYLGDPTSGSSSGSGGYRDSRSYDSRSSDPRNVDPRSSTGGNSGASNWSVQGHSFTIRDDQWSCDSVQLSSAGNAGEVRFSVSGTHTYPAGLDFELWHGRTVVVSSSSLPKASGNFSMNSVLVNGLAGDVRGEWELCVGDPVDDADSGRIDSWSIRASR